VLYYVDNLEQYRQRRQMFPTVSNVWLLMLTVSLLILEETLLHRKLKL